MTKDKTFTQRELPNCDPKAGNKPAQNKVFDRSMSGYRDLTKEVGPHGYTVMGGAGKPSKQSKPTKPSKQSNGGKHD